MDNLANKKKFYQSTWFCILMLMLVCPIGVFLMWKNEIFNKLVKIFLSIVAIPITFIGLIFWMAIFNPKPAIETTNKQVQIRNEQAKADQKNSNENKKTSSVKIDKEQLALQIQLMESIESDTKGIEKLYIQANDINNDGDGVDIKSLNAISDAISKRNDTLMNNISKLESITDDNTMNYYDNFIELSTNISQHSMAIVNTMIQEYQQGLTSEENKFAKDLINKYSDEVSSYDKSIEEMSSKMKADGISLK